MQRGANEFNPSNCASATAEGVRTNHTLEVQRQRTPGGLSEHKSTPFIYHQPVAPSLPQAFPLDPPACILNNNASATPPLYTFLTSKALATSQIFWPSWSTHLMCATGSQNQRPDYSRILLECGLAVIRIPIAEGFAPQKGIKEVNEVLNQVIQSYTVQGIDVLCHCRGGVGRAGLVACCCMLKIGLINRPSLISDPSNHAPLADYPHHQANHQTIASFNFQDQFHFHHHQPQPQPHPPDIFSFVDSTRLSPKNSVLGQVEKVIEVIRRHKAGLATRGCQDLGLTPNQRKRKSSKPNPEKGQATSSIDKEPKRTKHDRQPISSLPSDASPDLIGTSLRDRITNPTIGDNRSSGTLVAHTSGTADTQA
ncbi:hypothetical protein PTTG_10366 [Puccinia triticina 1-1 BBBD Race 1]|uniref:TYR_PHOSPHATASE_2 domain-containing protein n=1 Tax=Puccinia triticina (isolate 1-1 / race 1 (BBBD)) TaxID=630390 RepID=A0A180H3D6_PUCT1|nr:hypothetical protein PTTG_10366 [Puccinia triticina 1-1 BBBD Race 1]